MLFFPSITKAEMQEIDQLKIEDPEEFTRVMVEKSDVAEDLHTKTGRVTAISLGHATAKITQQCEDSKGARATDGVVWPHEPFHDDRKRPRERDPVEMVNE